MFFALRIINNKCGIVDCVNCVSNLQSRLWRIKYAEHFQTIARRLFAQVVYLAWWDVRNRFAIVQVGVVLILVVKDFIALRIPT